MNKVKKKKLKSRRSFLEEQVSSDSYYVLDIGKDSGYTSLKLADCNRTIEWQFGRPGEPRGKKKIATLKKLIDDMYNFLHEVEE